MSEFLTIIALLCVLAGIIGSIIPALPGPFISFIGMIILYMLDYSITTTDLVVCGIIILIVTIADYVLAPIFTKKGGGSKYAYWGSTIGVMVAIFILPISIFIAAFLGAYIGELVHDSTNQRKAIKVGFYSFLGFICGIFMQIVISIYIAFLSFKAVIILLADKI